MNIEDYLKFAIDNNCYKRKDWIINAFSIVKESPDAYKADPFIGRIVQTPTGMFFVVDEVGTLEKIDNYKGSDPLFRFKDIVVADSSICLNIQGKVETTIGNLLFNLISIVYSFGNVIPYMNGPVSVRQVEDIIAPILQDDIPDTASKDPSKIYVEDYIKFVDSLSYLTGFTQLAVWAATEKTMTAPTGLAKFKKVLLEKYKGRLTDPAAVAEMEAELLKFDAEYLKGDPGGENFATGAKMRGIVRKRLYLMFGADPGIKESNTINPVISSLEEGWEINKFPQLNDSLRIGSYSRGKLTQLGGVLTKELLRASSSVAVGEDDCGTTIGIFKQIDETNYKKLIGTYSIESNKSILIADEESAKKYIGKSIFKRSPMFCKSKGSNYCKCCLGLKLSANPSGLSLIISDYGSNILNLFMGKMHGTALALAKLDLTKSLT